MKGSNRFQILYGESIDIGTFYVTGQHGAGEAMDAVSGTDGERMAPTSAHLLGFLDKDVTTTGASYEDRSIGDPQNNPDKTGDYVTVHNVAPGGHIIVECEPDIAYNTDPSDFADPYLLVTSGTGQLTTSTAKDIELALQNGRWRAAQSADVVKGRVVNQLTPVIAATNVRIEIEILSGYVKA